MIEQEHVEIKPKDVAMGERTPPSSYRAHDATTYLRVMELEVENQRLQRLVGELLIKNQELRGSGSV